MPYGLAPGEEWDATTWGRADKEAFWQACRLAAQRGRLALYDTLAQAIPVLLEAGVRLDEEVGAWVLSAGRSADLDAWRRAFKSLVPALPELAMVRLNAAVGGSTTVLHKLTEMSRHGINPYQGLIRRLLQEGVSCVVPNAHGHLPIELATGLDEVREFLSAGSPLRSPDHRWLCRRAWEFENRPHDPSWVLGWEHLLKKEVRPVDRVSLVFELGRCRQAELLKSMLSSWQWDSRSLHGVSHVDPESSPDASLPWQWVGWIAYHTAGFVGVDPLLVAALASMGPDDHRALSPWNRLWLVVAAQQSKSSQSAVLGVDLEAAAKKALAPWSTWDDGLTAWVLSQDDLPVETRVLRYRRLRSVLVEMIQRVLGDPNAAVELQAHAAKWVVRFLREEAEGRMRMDENVYRQLRQKVLDKAWKTEPAADHPLVPAVCWAVVVSMGRFLEVSNQSLPFAPSKKEAFDHARRWVAEQPLGAWMARAPESAHALIEYGLMDSKHLPPEAQEWAWFKTWEQVLPRLREESLAQSLPAPSSGSAAARPRF